MHPRSRSLSGPLPQQPLAPSVIIHGRSQHCACKSFGQTDCVCVRLMTVSHTQRAGSTGLTHPVPAGDHNVVNTLCDLICMSFGWIYRPCHTPKPRELLEHGILAAHSGRLKSRLTAKCARRRGESAAVQKWACRAGESAVARPRRACRARAVHQKHVFFMSECKKCAPRAGES